MPFQIKPEPPDALYVTESSDGQLTGTPVSVAQQTPTSRASPSTNRKQPPPPKPVPPPPKPVPPPKPAEPPIKKPDPMDEASMRGIFGWTSIGDVNVPILFRGKDRIHYVAVRIVETKLLSRYPNVYPEELKEKPPLHSYYVTLNEVRLLNEINTHHCDFEYGHEPFTEKDLIVKLSEFSQFFNIVKATFPEERLQQMKFNPNCITRGGWVQINNTVIPYVYRDRLRFVSYHIIKYAAFLMTDSTIIGIPAIPDEILFFNRVCKDAGVEFMFDSTLELIGVDDVRTNCKPAVIELPSLKPFFHAKFLPPGPPGVAIAPPPGYQVAPPVVQALGPNVTYINQQSGCTVQYNTQGHRQPITPSTNGVQSAANSTPRALSTPNFMQRPPVPNSNNHNSLPNSQQQRLPPPNQNQQILMPVSAIGNQLATSTIPLIAQSRNQNVTFTTIQQPPVFQSQNHALYVPILGGQLLPSQQNGITAPVLNIIPPSTQRQSSPVSTQNLQINDLQPLSVSGGSQLVQRQAAPNVTTNSITAPQASSLEHFVPASDMPNLPQPTTARVASQPLAYSLAASSLTAARPAEVLTLSSFQQTQQQQLRKSNTLLNVVAQTDTASQQASQNSSSTQQVPDVIQASSIPPVTPSTTSPTISMSSIENKNFLSLKINANEEVVLVQDIVKQFFEPIPVDEFNYALTSVLKVQLQECSIPQEAALIKERGLNEQKLTCKKVIRVKDFCEYLPQLNYIYKDKLAAVRATPQTVTSVNNNEDILFIPSGTSAITKETNHDAETTSSTVSTVNNIPTTVEETNNVSISSNRSDESDDIVCLTEKIANSNSNISSKILPSSPKVYNDTSTEDDSKKPCASTGVLETCESSDMGLKIGMVMSLSEQSKDITPAAEDTVELICLDD